MTNVASGHTTTATLRARLFESEALLAQREKLKLHGLRPEPVDEVRQAPAGHCQ